ncbi:kinase-like protein [Rhizophagus irregularis]|uniref:Kinase-like protein n=1 Tax=Rhizophagus irregularis TaxID=588596 RepID=A0A2N1NIZ9_9GLOM|nr:kinase-like protein [Rhizophagus irregularis]
MTSVKEWIEEKIKNEYFRYFEYDEFSRINEIGRGNFGVVSKANLANTGLVALKIIISKNSDEHDEVNDELIKELKLLREVDYHPKINRCLGITKDSENYILVLEYANEGNLRKFLKKNFAFLKWNDKIQMALDITNGLTFLHSKGIIYTNILFIFLFHSQNILVNDRKLLIADLGLSKKLAEITTNSAGNRQGIIEYIEPQCFKNKKYKKDKKSDIYSLGVLLWEISSGRIPFSDCSRDLLDYYIKNGDREDPIDGTPQKYQKLYQECWNDEPKSRPDIEKVYEILSQLNTENSFYPQSSQPHIHNNDVDNNNNSKVSDIDDFYITSDRLNLNSRIKAVLQHHIIKTITKDIRKYFKQNLKEGSIMHLEKEIATMAKDLENKLVSFSKTRSGDDTITQAASIKVRQEVNIALGNRGFSDVLSSENYTSHGYIIMKTTELNREMNTYRTIKDVNKRNYVEKLAPDLIREFIRIFQFRLKVQEPSAQMRWIKTESSIDPSIMEGNWDKDDIDNLEVEICSFPMIGRDLEDVEKRKIYTHAQIFIKRKKFITKGIDYLTSKKAKVHLELESDDDEIL